MIMPPSLRYGGQGGGDDAVSSRPGTESPQAGGFHISLNISQYLEAQFHILSSTLQPRWHSQYGD
jgi:hypothetical protein